MLTIHSVVNNFFSKPGFPLFRYSLNSLGAQTPNAPIFSFKIELQILIGIITIYYSFFV